MIKTAINRPITTLMIFLSLVVFGIYSLKTMNVNLYPQVNIPIVKITTYANGDMNYIKTKITQKIEDEQDKDHAKDRGRGLKHRGDKKALLNQL